jgi:hypothetical protein
MGESRCGVTDAVLHQEIPVKVTAWVDEGVAPLVTALNEFERVITVDSCQGNAAKGAYVLFSYRGGSKEAARFASDLGEALEPLAPEFLLQAEWRPGGEGEPLLALTCPPDHVGRLADALNVCRTRLSVGGS